MSISDVRKQVCCNVCQELFDHSDVEVVNQNPDYPQDNNENDAIDSYDKEKLRDVGNFEENLDNSMGSDEESVGSSNEDNLMEKTNFDTIYHKDNLINSVGFLGKNCTKKSIYDDYPALHTEVIPINLPFSMKYIICSFEMNNGVDFAEDNIPLDLLKIPGKKKYFLQASNVLTTKLVAINEKHKKKLKERKDYTVMPLQGNKEDFAVHPRKLKVIECNIPEHFCFLTKYNQYNWIVPRGEFLFFLDFHYGFHS